MVIGLSKLKLDSQSHLTISEFSGNHCSKKVFASLCFHAFVYPIQSLVEIKKFN